MATLEVKAIGIPKPIVKWLRDDEEIFASEEYQIENFEDGTSILIINNIYPDDVGTISFEAHNSLGVAVTTTLFSVEGIFVRRKQQRIAYAFFLSDISFRCHMYM